MAEAPKILAFAASLRRGSFNVSTLKAAVRGAEAKGCQVTTVNLADYPLPFYDADTESAQGFPPKAVELRALLQAHRGLLLASPEYNSSLSALMKNTIDWLSRPAAGTPASALFRGKVAGLVAAAPTPSGGLRGLAPLSSILANIGVIVLPYAVGVVAADKAFDDQGNFLDLGVARRVEAVGGAVADFLQRRA